MRRGLVVWLVPLLAAGGPALCGAQPAAAPGPGPAVSVTVAGSAEAPADWAELTLTVEGQGATAEEALALCDASAQKALEELAALQIAPENLRLGPPEIGGGMDLASQVMIQLPGQGGPPAPTQTVRRSLTVRLSPFDPEAVYEWFCRVIDVGADAGATLGGGNPFMQALPMRSSPIVFGVSDPAPLRDEAIRNGLAAARAVANVAAADSGRELGDMVSILVAETPPEQAYAGLVSAMLSPPTAGRASRTVSVTVTYLVK
ncbi:MAG: DUF541 domain-containing protein [Armatimonadetes bacterium]|nr:DUF541 domain-containing protein [Armatimonadota bacterium]